MYLGIKEGGREMKVCKDCQDIGKPLVAHFNFCAACLAVRQKKIRERQKDEDLQISFYRNREIIPVDELTISDISDDELNKIIKDYENYRKNKSVQR